MTNQHHDHAICLDIFLRCDETHTITMSDYVKYPTNIVVIYDGDRIAKNDINALSSQFDVVKVCICV